MSKKINMTKKKIVGSSFLHIQRQLNDFYFNIKQYILIKYILLFIFMRFTSVGLLIVKKFGSGPTHRPRVI